MSKTIFSALLCTAVLSSGCGFHAAPLATGAVGGTAVGAGTGAIIGAVIANGDIGASALLGGAIGLPVGLAAAAIYDYHSERTMKEIQIAQLKINQKAIYERQKEIDALRESLRSEAPQGNPMEEREEYIYRGPSYANPYR